MPAKAETVEVGTSATDVACPTSPDDKVAVINIGANNVWVSHTDTAASVGGDDCECIIAGQATVLMWLPPGQVYSFIAETAANEINIVNRQGR